ncbi:MAG: RNA polymerase sigma factor [Deltaproteobacteria bacterium]|nr:RNA polymerase sigma factor [Deltaproteobacteria bacterium]
MAALRDPFSFARLAGVVDAEPRPASVDHQALTRLYEDHGGKIHRFLRDLLGDGALAADATQETFVRAYRQLGTFREGGAIVPWLFGIARNVSLEVRRARSRAARVIAPPSGDLPHDPPGPGSPETELLSREALRVVDGALAGLSEDRRAMLLLRLDHGLAYEEIASLMGFSLAKVKVEIFRAREALRSVMSAYEAGTGEGGVR